MYVPGSTSGMRDEDADVDADDGADNTEERERRELANKLDTDENAEEHERQQRRAVDAVVVVRVRRDVNGAEQRHRRSYVLLVIPTSFIHSSLIML